MNVVHVHPDEVCIAVSVDDVDAVGDVWEVARARRWRGSSSSRSSDTGTGGNLLRMRGLERQGHGMGGRDVLVSVCMGVK